MPYMQATETTNKARLEGQIPPFERRVKRNPYEIIQIIADRQKNSIKRSRAGEACQNWSRWKRIST